VHSNPNYDSDRAGNEQDPTEQASHPGTFVQAWRRLNGSQPGIAQRDGRQYADKNAGEQLGCIAMLG